MDAIAKLTRLSTLLALLLATLFSVVIPAGYFYIGYQNQQAVITTEAEMNAILVSAAISASPDYWQFEERRLAEILSSHHIVKGEAKDYRIVDVNNTVIVQSGREIAPPHLLVAHKLFDSGEVVGQIIITSSLRHLLLQTMVVGIISLLFGLAIFVSMKFIPLRALATALRSVYEERERALSLLNNIPDLAWLKDRDDRFIAVNEPFGRLCRIDPRTLPGMTDLDIWPKELAEKYRADDREVMASGRPKEIEEEVIDSEGRSTWIATIKCPVFNDQNEVIGTTGIGRDITARKEMENELKKASDFYLTLFEKFPALIWRAGIDKKCNYFNATWLAFTGRPLELEMGDGWAEGVHPDDLARCFITYVEAFDRHEPFRMEYRLKHHSGEYRWITDFGEPFHDTQGEFAGYIGTCFDITASKNADDKIHQLNAELEQKVEERTSQLLVAQETLLRKEKLAILGQLSGSVSHELRNPLGVMNNALFFLKMINTDATTGEYLDIIKHEIDISLRIITDLLDFARTKHPQTETVPTRKLLEESLGKCTIPESVELGIDLPDDLPLIKVDPLQMGQVFSNLLCNAIQAMPDGGTVHITARFVGAPPFGCPEAGGHGGPPLPDFMAISITDNGEGITPENMNNLFQPLFTTKAKGIGLGLVVCKNLVEANGGQIEVASEVGVGTTFTVYLPAAGV